MQRGSAGRTGPAKFGLLLLCLLAAATRSPAQAPAGDAATAGPPPEGELPYPTPLPGSTQLSPADGPAPPDPAIPPPQPAPTGPAPGPAGMMGMGMGGMGMGGMGMMGMAGFARRVPYLGGYQGAEYFNAPVRDQNAHLGYYQQSLFALTPIWQDRTDAVMANALVGATSFNTNAILPDTRQPFPSELWNVNLGGNYRHLFDNGWVGGGGVFVGSPSDRPFSNFKDMSVSVNGSLRVPSGQRNAWIFGVALSSNSQVLQYIPIPTVAYLYSPNPRFMALAGFPFATAMWRPADDWVLFASYALLTNFHARVNYRLVRQTYLFAGLDFQNQNYFLADRTVAAQHFYMYDDRISTGVQAFLWRHVALNVSGGYIFARRFFESTNGTSASSNVVDVGAGAFVGAAVQVLY